MLAQLRRAIVISIVFIAILGLAYPALETGIGQLFFHGQANGSLTSMNGKVTGSNLVGQAWTGPRWFQGRPDAYNPMASGGSNLGPRSQTLVNDVSAAAKALRKEGILPTNDLVTTSFSGMDPDITEADAMAQVNAVARANGLSVAKVRALVVKNSQPAEWGFLGAPYVNVLALNESLAKAR